MPSCNGWRPSSRAARGPRIPSPASAAKNSWCLLQDTSLAGACLVCERLRTLVQNHPWQEVTPGLQVTISFGLEEAGATQDCDHLLRTADARLYQAKRNGRNRIEPLAPLKYLHDRAKLMPCLAPCAGWLGRFATVARILR